MKTKTVILLLLFISFADVFFYSCCHCNEEVVEKMYYHKSLSVSNLDNSGAYITESDAPLLNKNAYGIRIVLERELLASLRPKQVFPMLIQQANATSCDCIVPFLYSEREKITSIHIISVSRFDDQHLENSDITPYFRTYDLYQTADEYLAHLKYEIDRDWDDFKLDLLLMTAPTDSSIKHFKVIIKLSDGRILEQITTGISLL
ncbi:MAG: DUF5034 domain-containing protein [Capnocytophaga sp.]|nr:DUF5034 domain-containing protein [Capnocytophaga sp.]